MKVEIGIIENGKQCVIYEGEYPEGILGLDVSSFNTPIDSSRYSKSSDTLYVSVKQLPKRIDYDVQHNIIFLVDRYNASLFPNGFSLNEAKCEILWSANNVK